MNNDQGSMCCFENTKLTADELTEDMHAQLGHRPGRNNTLDTAIINETGYDTRTIQTIFLNYSYNNIVKIPKRYQKPYPKVYRNNFRDFE